MALPFPISSTQTDAKSPVDDNLMDSIRLNEEYLDSLFTAGGAAIYPWVVNGHLSLLPGRIAKRIDMQFLHQSQTFTRVRLAQGKSGSSGVTEIDIRYHTTPKTPIIAIAPQFQANTTGVAQIKPNLATQSITRATAQVATQSISRWKSALNVQSIIYVGTDSFGTPLWRYNLNSAPDADWRVGDYIRISGCTDANNNFTATSGLTNIVEINQSGYPSIVVANFTGVAQTGVAGTIDLEAWKYALVNPASSWFTAANGQFGNFAVFTGHTNTNNNGITNVYAINQGGNNIIVKNFNCVAQAGVAGNIDTCAMIYSYGSAVGSDFVVGEFAAMSAHTTSINNGSFEILAVNSGGNNLVVQNFNNGVIQGGSAGVANTRRFKYTFGADPSANVSVNDTVIMKNHDDPDNDGTYTVKAVNHTTNDNIVVVGIFNVDQVGSAGFVRSARKLVKFSSDQSLLYSTDSYIEMEGCPDAGYNSNKARLPFKVLQVNRGGGANYNVVISVPDAAAQASPAGYVTVEARSIFTAGDGSKPQLSADITALNPNSLLKMTSTAISGVAVPAQTFLGLYLLRVQNGEPQDLSVVLS